MKLPDKKL